VASIPIRYMRKKSFGSRILIFLGQFAHLLHGFL
jgi:hypothetical protein